MAYCKQNHPTSLPKHPCLQFLDKACTVQPIYKKKNNFTETPAIKNKSFFSDYYFYTHILCPDIEKNGYNEVIYVSQCVCHKQARLYWFTAPAFEHSRNIEHQEPQWAAQVGVANSMDSPKTTPTWDTLTREHLSCLHDVVIPGDLSSSNRWHSRIN